MKYAMGLLFIIGVGMVVGGIWTVISGGPADAHLEYHFSGTVGAIGGVVMILTALMVFLPVFDRKRPQA